MSFTGNFYGFKVQLTGPQSVVFNLSQDFFYFIEDDCSVHQVKISIKSLSESPKKLGFPIFKTRMCRVHQAGFNKRNCIYKKGGRLLAVCSLSESRSFRDAVIYCDDDDLAYEIAYTFIMSAVGEELDGRGMMRVHGAAMRLADKNILILARSGTGKSSLVNEMMSGPEYFVFSDEVGLVSLKNAFIFPFPVRMAFKEPLARGDEKARIFKRQAFDAKFLYKIPENKIAAAGPLDRVFYYQKNSGYQNAFVDVVLGLGVQQMAEFMLRPNNLFRLAKILYYRCRLFFILKQKGGITRLVREESSKKSAQTLMQFADSPL